jgi:hypothetical protein
VLRVRRAWHDLKAPMYVCMCIYVCCVVLCCVVLQRNAKPCTFIVCGAFPPARCTCCAVSMRSCIAPTRWWHCMPCLGQRAGRRPLQTCSPCIFCVNAAQYVTASHASNRSCSQFNFSTRFFRCIACRCHSVVSGDGPQRATGYCQLFVVATVSGRRPT